MSLKVREEALHVQNWVGENTAQAVLQDTLELPATARDIQRLVAIRPSLTVTQSKVAEDKVVMEGHVDLQVVYMGELSDEEPPAHCRLELTRAILFDQYVEIIGASPEMAADVRATILDVDFEVKPDGRSLEVKALAHLRARVYLNTGFQAVTNATISPPKKLTVSDLPIATQSLVDDEVAQRSVDGSVALPAGSADIAQVLLLDVQAYAVDTAFVADGVEIDCRVCAELVYLGTDDVVHHAKWDEALRFPLPVSTKPIQDGVNVVSEFAVTAQHQVGRGGSSLDLELDVTARIMLIQTSRTRIVLDISSSSGERIEVRTSEVRLDTLVNEKTQQSSAQGVIEVGDEYPPIREIIQAIVTADVSDYRLDEDKAILEGDATVEILYLAHTDEEQKPLYRAVFADAIPISQVLAVGGVQPGMVAQLDIEVSSVSLDLINRETVEVDLAYRTHAKIWQSLEEEVVVEALEVTSPDPDPPTITYVVIQGSDTLWKLSKRYQTPVQAIVNANSWLREREDAVLFKGDKVCIPRKH